MRIILCAAALAAMYAGVLHTVHAQVRITEWMYCGNDGEFIEITNLGPREIDLTGWSYDDDSRVIGKTDLSPLGTLAAGESAIISEIPASDFRARWGLGTSVKVLGENATNLSRNDEINIYNNVGDLVDRLAYGDQTFADTIRAKRISGRPGSTAALGANNVALWVASSSSDGSGTFVTNNGGIGDPGYYTRNEPELPDLVFGAAFPPEISAVFHKKLKSRDSRKGFSKEEELKFSRPSN